MLRVRWLGRVRHRDAHAIQRALFERSPDDHLLLLEHPHVYTLGVRAKLEHLLVPPADVGAELVRTDRGGDVTYHGPGQLVGYPILTVAPPGGIADTPAYVASVEQLLIDVLADLGLGGAGRLDGYPGVWVDPDGPSPRKIAAIGVRLTRGRSMHGFALNVDPDLSFFSHIVPCGIADKAVTSLAAEGISVSMADVVDAVARRAVERWAPDGRWDRQDVAFRVRPTDLAAFTRGEGPGAPVAPDAHQAPDSPGPVDRTAVPHEDGSSPGTADRRAQPVRLLGRLAAAGVDPAAGRPLAERKPEWMRVKAEMGSGYRELKKVMRSLDLVTVCEEAGCPNIFECWGAGTATFMVAGERCTRACGFCLVDTRHPLPLAADESERVAEAVDRMGLAHAVVTMVARDDLADGAAGHIAETIRAIRRRSPSTAVEVLVSDLKGDPDAIATVVDARPDVFNHNIETVARLQRAVRPSASYARSLAVLARAADAGVTTKSGFVLGMGEEEDEVIAALADLRAVGVDIVTLGQYLRPTSNHLPVARWWTPEDFDRVRVAGEAMGFAHVQASPLTRSSYHARDAASAAVAGAATTAG